MRSLDVPIGPFMEAVTVTVNLTGVKRATLRLTAAGWIIRLAAWVAGCDINVNVEEGE